MAKSVADAFNQFHDNKLALTQAQQTKVDQRFARATELLRAAFPTASGLPIADVRLIGSAARGTIIRPLNDLDVLARFANKEGVFEKYRHDSQAFLYRVTNAIKARTEVKQVGARGQAVRLFYTDDLHVDIAPVFAWTEGGYGLPSGDGSWITTDPPKQNGWLEERHMQLGRQLKRKVRFLKRWNQEHSARLASFHLEVMTASTFSSLGRDTRAALRVFFENASLFLDVQDPAGYGGELSSYLSSSARSGVIQSFAAAAERVEKAILAEAVGNHEEALRLWRIVLGPEVPAYG
ncbi:MAG: hypothetical protein M3198_18405 [Actinomycetota bacterium]|nr:hypothetical protein [Actinomycetota bacterium]